MDMNRLSRRTYLASAAAAAAALAGCSADSDGGGGGNDNGSTGTATGEDGDAGADALTLESLAVGGSPGGDLAVDPAGQPLLLDFFATWCAPCKPQMESLRAVDGSYDSLRMRSLTRETDREAILDFWQTYEGTWPVAMDPELFAFEQYGVTRVPVLVVLDADGEEVWRHAGLASEDAIRDAVEEAGA